MNRRRQEMVNAVHPHVDGQHVAHDDLIAKHQQAFRHVKIVPGKCGWHP